MDSGKRKKRVPRSQPPTPGKGKQAKVAGSRERLMGQRFRELVRSQMFHRK